MTAAEIIKIETPGQRGWVECEVNSVKANDLIRYWQTIRRLAEEIWNRK